MGLFNILKARMTCPRCRAKSAMEVELFFGLKNQIRYQLGDKIVWRRGKAAQNGGRPEGGNINGEGYTECPICNKDFFVQIAVRNDEIQSVKVNPDKEPYIKDE